MSSTVPLFVWFVALGVASALVASLALAVRRGSPARGAGPAIVTAAILAIWLAAVVALAAAGLFRGAADNPPRIGSAVALPVLVGALALAISGDARAFAARIPQPWLIAPHVLRVLGVVFLVLQARDVLPAHFALPAGLGDIAIGLAAPFVALALSRGALRARGAAIAWNLLGILDLLVAVGVGALTAESSVRVFFSTPSTDAMAVLPLSVIPTFAVPLFILMHVVSLMGLRRGMRRAAGEVGAPGARVATAGGAAR